MPDYPRSIIAFQRRFPIPYRHRRKDQPSHLQHVDLTGTKGISLLTHFMGAHRRGRGQGVIGEA